MLTLLNPVKHALIDLLKKSRATIFPFNETPAVTKNEEEGENKTGPTELFSMFTADIIKEDVVFTR